MLVTLDGIEMEVNRVLVPPISNMCPPITVSERVSITSERELQLANA